jgi:glycosyltransferase involved in cell wall biosynthesis
MSKRGVILELIESSGIGGAEAVVLELCKRLDRGRFYPIVVLLHDGWLNRELLAHGIETKIIKNKHPYDPFFLWELVNTIKKRKVDLLHSHEFMMNVYGTIAGLLVGKPNVVTIHGKNYFFEKWRRKFAYRLVGHFATEIVVVSEDLRTFVAERVGIDRRRMSVIYNGVDVAKFDENSSGCKERMMGSEGLDELGKPIIGTVGNLYPVKGQIYLIRAAAEVIKEFPNSTFLIIGKKTDYLNELENEVKNLNIKKNVSFLGFREDAAELIKMMDVFVLPSLQESFSIATIEAMASSKPVVVTKCGGPEELVIDDRTGFLVKSQDPEELAEKILILLRNKTLGEEMGRAGRRRVVENFTVEAMIKDYQRLYERVFWDKGCQKD